MVESKYLSGAKAVTEMGGDLLQNILEGVDRAMGGITGVLGGMFGGIGAPAAVSYSSASADGPYGVGEPTAASAGVGAGVVIEAPLSASQIAERAVSVVQGLPQAARDTVNSVRGVTESFGPSNDLSYAYAGELVGQSPGVVQRGVGGPGVASA